MVPVPTTCTIFFMGSPSQPFTATPAKDTMRAAFSNRGSRDRGVQARSRDASRGRPGASKGLWKEGRAAPGSAAPSSPTRTRSTAERCTTRSSSGAAQALTARRLRNAAVQLSRRRALGRAHDDGRGEVEDFRAALDEAERSAGFRSWPAGSPSGPAAALRAIAGRRARVVALVAAGLPLATDSGARVCRGPRSRRSSSRESGMRSASGAPRGFVGDSGHDRRSCRAPTISSREASTSSSAAIGRFLGGASRRRRWRP